MFFSTNKDFFFKEHPWLLVESGFVLEPVKTRAAQYLLLQYLWPGLCVLRGLKEEMYDQIQSGLHTWTSPKLP